MRDYKKHTSDRLLRHLEVTDQFELLKVLANKVKRPEKQPFKVWEDGYLAKDVLTKEFVLQKMECIHNNPCQPHWNLSDSPESYIWSSAHFYLTDESCIIPVDDVRKLL